MCLYGGFLSPVAGSVQFVRVPYGPLPSPPGISDLNYVHMHIIKRCEFMKPRRARELNLEGPGEKGRRDTTNHTLYGEGEVQPFPQAGLQGIPGAWQAHRGGLLLRG
jgi:hypothetical protein